jgi:hypothetical protein
MIVIVTIIHFSLRLPRIQLVPRGVDAHFHLLATSKFKGGRPPKVLGRFLIGDTYTHPPFLHFLLSLVPERLRPQALFMFDITADYLLALLAYCLALQYMPELYALVAAVLYSVTPASYMQSVSESARPLGAFWYSLSIVLLPNEGVLAMVLATVTVALTLLSHKMATQTLLFTCLLLSPLLYTANNFFPLPLLAGFALALLLTKGEYMKILKDHAAYIGFHLRYGSWDRGKKMPGSPKQLVKFQPYFYLPLIGLWLYPQALLGATSLILAWYAFMLVIFFVWLWGDSHRYLAYSAIPTAILSALAMHAGMNALLIIPALVISAAVISRNILAFYRQPALPDFARIDLPKDSVTLVMPSSIIYVSSLHLNGRLLYGGGNADAVIFDLQTLPKIMSTAPEKLLEEYPITHVLLGPKNQDFIKPIGNSFEQVLETNGYILFKRK